MLIFAWERAAGVGVGGVRSGIGAVLASQAPIGNFRCDLIVTLSGSNDGGKSIKEVGGVSIEVEEEVVEGEVLGSNVASRHSIDDFLEAVVDIAFVTGVSDELNGSVSVLQGEVAVSSFRWAFSINRE
jgi:hypothetical protein